MMRRTQISLDFEMLQRARRKAARSGISLAEYFRRLVARDLSERAARPDPSAVFDLGDSGGSDVSREKDRMIGEAVVAERSTRPGTK